MIEMRKEFIDKDGIIRIFEIRRVPLLYVAEYEAIEIQEGREKGYRFVVLDDYGNEKEMIEILEAKIKRALSIKHVIWDENSQTWLTRDNVIRARIEMEPSEQGNMQSISKKMPVICIDGKELSWEEFGKLMLVYERSQFVLEFFDLSEDIYQIY